MAEPLPRDHGLAPFLASVSDVAGSDDGLRIQILPALGAINLRGKPGESEFVAAVSSILGQGLPVAANTMTIGDHRVYWLGPDEWLIVTPHAETGGLLTRLRDIQCTHAALTDVSGGNIVLRLSGRGVRDVLAKGCTLDFDLTSFQPGMCAQSGLARATVLIAFVDAQPVYEIVIRRSFSEYLLLWLQSAAREFDVGYATD